MNRKHLLWHVFDMMDKMDIDVGDFCEAIGMSDAKFSDSPQPGELSVSDALYERYEAYKKALKNG